MDAIRDTSMLTANSNKGIFYPPILTENVHDKNCWVEFCGSLQQTSFWDSISIFQECSTSAKLLSGSLHCTKNEDFH